MTTTNQVKKIHDASGILGTVGSSCYDKFIKNNHKNNS